LKKRKRPRWRLLDHTADTGMEIEADDLPQLFALAAEALFAQIADIGGTRVERTDALSVSGIDWPDLMFNWLRELLYLWTGGQRLVFDVCIRRLVPHSIRAGVRSVAFDPSVDRIDQEIKAVTYHQLRVDPAGDGWRARVFFDV